MLLGVHACLNDDNDDGVCVRPLLLLLLIASRDDDDASSAVAAAMLLLVVGKAKGGSIRPTNPRSDGGNGEVTGDYSVRFVVLLCPLFAWSRFELMLYFFLSWSQLLLCTPTTSKQHYTTSFRK